MEEDDEMKNRQCVQRIQSYFDMNELSLSSNHFVGGLVYKEKFICYLNQCEKAPNFEYNNSSSFVTGFKPDFLQLQLMVCVTCCWVETNLIKQQTKPHKTTVLSMIEIDSR